MKYLPLVLLLLMSLASFGQSNPTTFTNPAAGFHTGNFSVDISTENGQPVNHSACPGGSGCFVSFQLAAYVNDLGIWFPDINLACHIAQTVVSPPGFCFTSGCQSVTYTAVANTSGPEDDACKGPSGRVWTITTTQKRHWVRSGFNVYGPTWEGGFGTISHN